jgi:hypothetical protein
MSVQTLDSLRVITKVLIWSALAGASVWISDFTESRIAISFVPRLLLCLLLVGGLWMALARVRRAVATVTAQLLIRSGIRPLVCAGVWGVLMVSQPPNAAVASTLAGRDRLYGIYEAMDAMRRAKIIAAVQWIEQSSPSLMAREAAVFLETVGW